MIFYHATPPPRCRTMPWTILRRMPKAELHLHLEGTITPRTWRQVLLRHAPRTTPSLEDLQRAYQFQDITGFFDTFLTVVRSLREPEDYQLIAREAGRALARENVRYAEFHISIAAAQWAGRLAGDDIIPAIAAGLAEAKRAGGPAWCLIVDVIRDLCGQGCGEIALDLAVRHRGHGVAALGMGGTEALPATVARDVFTAGRAAGLRLTAHAGEQAGPDSIWGALEIGAERIGHATRACEDPALLDELTRSRTPLEMCLTSNVRTGAVPSAAAHPLGTFLRRGMNVSLSTDDPPFFGTRLTLEYERAARTFGFTQTEILHLARRAFTGSFLSEDGKATLLAEFDAFGLEIGG